MKYRDIGRVPVIDSRGHEHLVGLITHRDIAIRCVARRHPSDCTVAEHMTPQPLVTVLPDASVDEIVDMMECTQVRRIPVVDGSGALIGIVAERDLTTKLPAREALPARKRMKRATPRSVATF